MNQSSSTGIAGKTKHRAPIREPRETLTINHVEDAILHLIENGKTPSEANVRGILGGSPNTLHPLVRRWFAERAPALLHGQITVVNSSDIPKAAHELIAELREDARRAADEALAREWSDVEAEREATQKTLKMAESKENELAKKAEENERIIPIFKANLELASAELAAARASAASAASDRRESEARRQAAEAIAKDAERRLEQAQAAIKTANDSLSTLSEDLTASRLVADAAKAAVAAKQAELDRVASEAAAQ
ncbi:MAG: hypothetical protein DDT34_01678 [Firmicutes bacterium]|nr:hypothetical protein [Bacillota bacterium]